MGLGFNMKIDFKKRSTWIYLFSIILAVAAMSYAYAELRLGYTAQDRQIARDLAALSGLTEDDVFGLYDARGTWEPVIENIFVYKQILADFNTALSRNKTFELIKAYEPSDILTVDEFLTNYRSDYASVEDYLMKHNAGQSFEEIFALDVTSKAYLAYQPMDKDTIRQYLKSGYLPQDIINADSIALAKDLQINEILAMKTKSTKWEAIADSLGYEFKDENTPVTITLPNQTEPLTATDYETLIKQANSIAEQNKQQAEQKFAVSAGIAAAKMTEYKDKGYSFRDIQNAYRLAQELGIEAEPILERRSTGLDWKTIISEYRQERMKADA